MLAFYLLAIASGALAAVAVALWMRVRRLDKQNDAFLEMMEDTLSQGMKIRVRVGLSSGDRTKPSRGGAKPRPKRRPAKATKAPSPTTPSPKASPRSGSPPSSSIVSFEGAQITLQSLEIVSGVAMFTIQVSHKGEKFRVKKKAAQLQALAKNVQAAWVSLDPKANKAQKLPKFSFPEDFSAPGSTKQAEESFAEYFKKLPAEALSLPLFMTFFERKVRPPKTRKMQAPPGGEKKEKAAGGGVSEKKEKGAEAPKEAKKDLPIPKVPDGLNCVNLKNDSPVEYIEGYNYLDTGKKIMSLTRGKTFFTFACHSGKTLTEKELLHVDSIVNLSGFKDELAENGIEYINIRNREEAALYTVAIVKNGYMLPHTKLEDFTPELLCSHEYLHACMPGPPKIWKEVPDNTHFRITKTIIPWVFNMTIQFKVSVLDPKTYPALSQLDNCPVHKAIILERTKRDKTAQDATKKAKSVLLYTKVDGGTFCRNITICLNSFVPNFVVPFIDTLGSLGSKETKETAVMTRNFFKKQAKKKGRL